MAKFSRVILAAAFACGMSFVSFCETVVPSAFDYRIGYVVSGYEGTTAIVDLPVLVRLKDNAPIGFSYADCPQDSIRFADGDGNLIPHEIDTWNASGESLIWVKVSSVSGQETAFTMYYGGDDVKPSALPPSEVWTNYRGVWHLNESGDDGGTTDPVIVVNATSSGADLNGEAYGGTVGVAGKIGGGRRISDSTDIKSALGGIWIDGSKDCADVGSKLTISGWMIHRNQAYYYDHVFYRREASNSTKGGIAIEVNNAANSVAVRGNGNTSSAIGIPSAVKTDWTYLSFVYNEKTATVYANGEKTGSGTIGAATDNDLRWVFGNDTDGYKGATGDISWKGSMDEIRLSAVAQTADYIKAEYQAMGPDFITAGAVEVLDPTAPVFEAPTVLVASDGTATMTFTITSGEGDISTVVGDVTNLIGMVGVEISLNEPKTVPITIDEGECVSVGVYGINAKGTEVAKYADGAAMNATIVAVATNDANERGLVPGVFTVSRPDGVATDLPIVVNLTWDGGTAVQGKNYVEELPATVTIPADAASTTVVITPIIDTESQNDETVVLTVSSGAYKSGATATMKILNLVADPNYNTWVAAADGLASDAANWSKGVPQSDHKILFDPQFSNANCEWDGGVNGLSDIVASWTQKDGYIGKVTVRTMYPEAPGATFTKLTVTGDMLIAGGMLTQVSNDVQKEEYRLNVGIGGNLTIGSAGSIDVTGRGPRGVMSGRSANVYAGDQNTYQKTYGDPKRPYYCGSGNNGAWPTSYKGAGGGAAWIEVAGAATVNGKILSEGSILNSNMGTFDGKSGNISTSGGSVYLKASTLAGDGNGLISAKSEFSCNQDNQIGSGGRIAVELTETAYDFESGGVRISANANAKQAGSPGHGTIVIKNPGEANGTLYVLGKSDRNFSYNNCEYTYQQTTAIPKGDTWTFDKVVIGDFGMITVGEGSTLSLPNGWASVYAKNKSTDALKKYACGIILRGGTLNVPAVDGKHEFKNGAWTFHPTGGYVLNANAEISGGASVGAMYLSAGTNTAMACDVKVAGNLDVKSDGFMNAVFGGIGGTATFAGEAYTPFHKATVAFGTGHGGQNAHIGTQNLTYGSFFNPVLPGTPSGHADVRYVGSGVIILEVSGTLNVDGKIQTCSGWDGQYWADRPSAPGSVNITAAQLSGSGSIRADGAAGYIGMYPKTNWETQGPAGGGRVAVRLTGSGATMPDSLFAKITAKGASPSGTLKSDTADANVRYSSAGSVYLQTAAEGEKKGTIIIRNDGVAANTAWTSLPAAAETDAVADFKNASLSLLDCGKVRLYDTVQMAKLTLAADCKIDLNGNTLTVQSAKLGDTTLAAGTYAAGAAALGDFVTDSVGGGSLIVKTAAKRGLTILFR